VPIRTLFHSLLQSLGGPPPASPPPLDDPTFGRIEFFAFDGGNWGTEDLRVPGASERPMSVTIPGDANGPSADGRRRFAEIVERLPELRAQAEPLLAEDYRAFRGEPRVRAKQLPAVERAGDIWQLADLAGIWLVQPPAEEPADFELHFAMAWDDDHQCVALFRDWRLTRFYKDG
jgi:hypothetical protein